MKNNINNNTIQKKKMPYFFFKFFTQIILINYIKNAYIETISLSNTDFYLRHVDSLEDNQTVIILAGYYDYTTCYILEVNTKENNASKVVKNNCNSKSGTPFYPVLDYIKDDQFIFLYSKNSNNMVITAINDSSLNINRADLFTSSPSVFFIGLNNYNVLLIYRNTENDYINLKIYNIQNHGTNFYEFQNSKTIGISTNIVSALNLKNDTIFIVEYNNKRFYFSFFNLKEEKYYGNGGEVENFQSSIKNGNGKELYSIELNDTDGTNIRYIVQCFLADNNELQCFSGYYNNEPTYKYYVNINLVKILKCSSNTKILVSKASDTIIFAGCLNDKSNVEIARLTTKLNLVEIKTILLSHNDQNIDLVPLNYYKFVYAAYTNSRLEFNIQSFATCPINNVYNLSNSEILHFPNFINVKDFERIKLLSLPQVGNLCNTESIAIQYCTTKIESISASSNTYYITRLYYYYNEEGSKHTLFTYLILSGSYESEVCTAYINICYPTCKTCSALGDETNNYCTECREEANFYWKENKNDQKCINKNVPGYYLDPATTFNGNINTLKKCYFSCYKCNAAGNSVYHNCKEKCIDDYYKFKTITDTTFNCYHKDDLIDGYYANNDESKFEKCENNGCKTCSKETNDYGENHLHLCLSCNYDYGYYPIYYDELLDGKRISDCITLDMLKYEDSYKNYYFDEENKEIKKCYKLCGSCSKGGDELSNNCETCIDNLQLSKDGSKNCICNDSYNYYYIDENDNDKYVCVEECLEPRPFITRDILNLGKCVESCENKRYNNLCVDKCPNGTELNFTTNKCEDLNKCAKNEYISNIKYEVLVDNGDDAILISMAKSYLDEYKTNDKIIKIIKSEDNKYDIILFKNTQCLIESIYNELIKIDLDNCMKAIRIENRLPSNYPLIVVLLNIHRNENENSQLEYGFFSELSQNKFYSKEPCLTTKPTIIVPMESIKNINLTEAKKFKENGINVFNESDDFYNDLCYQYSDEYGNDVTLSDRYNNYYQNVSFCDDNCEINGYNFDLLEVNCSCKIKESISYEINENKYNIKENKSEGLTIFDVGKCSKNTFNNLKNNIGSYTVGSMVLIQTISVISYLKIGLNGIKSFILIFISNPPKLLIKSDNNTIETNNEDLSSGNTSKKNLKKEIDKNKKESQNINYIKNKNYYDNYFKYYLNDEKFDDDEQKSENENQNDIFNIKKKKLQKTTEDNNYLEKNFKINNNENVLNNNIEKQINDNNNNYLTNISRNNQFDSKELVIQNINSSEDNKTIQKMNNVTNENKKRYQNLVIQNDYNNENNKIGYYINNMGSDRNSFSILRVNKHGVNYKSFIHDDKDQINIDGIKLNEKINKKFIKDIIENENLDLNELDYFNAIKLDKRSFCNFYCDQIKYRQSIIYVFFIKNPIEPISIKIIIFCFQLILCFITNCLFYSKRYLSKKYYSKQKNDFIYLIKNGWVRIILSSLLTLLIILIIGILYNPQKKIVKIIRKEKDKNIRESECVKCYQQMKIMNIIFLIINFICMIIFWYFLSLFCFVYKNTVIDWIYGSIITFIIIQIFPFIGVLLVTSLRFIGLKYNSECSYKISIYLTI